MSNGRKVMTGILLTMAVGRGASAQLWQEFAHPDEPHQVSSFLPPIVFDEFFNNESATRTVPMVVVLMEFSDQAHNGTYTAQYFQEMFFGGGMPAGAPTVAEHYEQVSNGRVTIVPAAETHGPDNDGIIGWVEAQNGDSSQDLQVKRAEAVVRADPFMNFAQYDTNGDGRITNHELILVLVNPGNGGGQTHPTNPTQIAVDGGAMIVEKAIGALGEQRLAAPHAHESSHPFLGLGDIYSKCNADWSLGDGYICEILSDDCTAPNNEECGCPDALDPNPVVSIAGSTVGYPSAFGPACDGAAALSGPTAWFEVYGTGNTFTASTCGAGFDTHISVFCNGCDSLTCVDGNDDACGSGSTATWCTEPDVSYLIAVHGGGAATGNFTLEVEDEGINCVDFSGVECGLAAAHSRHWYPFNPSWTSIMASGFDSQTDTVVELDPWAKIHLGFTKPKVVSDDGTYTVYAAETVRSFAQQDNQPEAFIIYDPLKPIPARYREYFIVEMRNDPLGGDTGLAIWLINEDWIEPYPGLTPNLRRAVRLVQRGGHNVSSDEFLWDPDEPSYYDFGPDSFPRNSAWSNGTPSYVEIYDMVDNGTSMTFKVRMPPIFVDVANDWITLGTPELPFDMLGDAVDAINNPPRTIRIAGGNYDEGPLTISTPCTIIHWKGGAANIGQ